MRKLAGNKSKSYSGFFGKFLKISVDVMLWFFFIVLELGNSKIGDIGYAPTISKLTGDLDDLYFVKSPTAKHDKSYLELQVKTVKYVQKYDKISDNSQKEMPESVKLQGRLRELEMERNALHKQRSSSCFARNLKYPLAMLLHITALVITILLVVQNTIELLIGIKALPMSSRVRFLHDNWYTSHD